MPFRSFHDLFPELAERETRTLIVLPEADIGVPPDKYGLLEMYCDEPGCDCRRVFFSVFSSRNKRIDAVVAWGWEDVKFYSRWMTHGNCKDAKYLKGPSLNLGSPKAVHAPALLALVRNILGHDPSFVERIKRHYAMFRTQIETGNVAEAGESHKARAHEAELKPSHCAHRAYCFFCGSTIGQESDRTGGIVAAVYDCVKCRMNYCSECSYAQDGSQYCLRCDSILAKVAPRDDPVIESMPPPDYQEPVGLLLSLGYPESEMDYAALGLGQEHIDDLIRMATEMTLHREEEGGNAVYAPVHAWRALGQLRAEAAIEPLISLFSVVDEDNDEWAEDDLPQVLGEIGAAAIPALTAYIQDASRGSWARIAASESLKCIAKRRPEARQACVAALTEQLEHFTANDGELNAFLIWWLRELNAVESAPAMAQAFAANAVDLSVVGDWEDMQIELGLLDKRITPRPRWGWGSLPVSAPKINTPQALGKSHAKAKKKRKNQKASRRKNRNK